MEKIAKYLKEHKMSIFVIVSAVVMLIGLSYAWLQLTLRGQREINIFAAGTLQLELDDTMTNGISVENAVPITDEEGKAQTAYTFTLTNKGTVDSDYTIYLDDLDLEEGQTRMSDDFTFGSDELSGIWVGKFETSSSNSSAEYGGGNTTELDVMIKQNVTS